MYTFGEPRKQKHPKAYNVGDYLLPGAEPVISSKPSSKMPTFTFMNYYLTKHRIQRHIRQIRRHGSIS